jgi:hypothetical protein
MHNDRLTTPAAAPASLLLSRLDKVRPTGPGRWLARCPAHEDRSPSLSVREMDDGRLLVHCFTGCPTADVLSAVGLEFADLFPDRCPDHGSPEKRPFPALDALRALHFEALVVSVAAGALRAGKPLDEADMERLALAQQRIQAAVALVGGHRHG